MLKRVDREVGLSLQRYRASGYHTSQDSTDTSSINKELTSRANQQFVNFEHGLLSEIVCSKRLILELVILIVNLHQVKLKVYVGFLIGTCQSSYTALQTMPHIEVLHADAK